MNFTPESQLSQPSTPHGPMVGWGTGRWSVGVPGVLKHIYIVGQRTDTFVTHLKWAAFKELTHLHN